MVSGFGDDDAPGWAGMQYSSRLSSGADGSAVLGSTAPGHPARNGTSSVASSAHRAWLVRACRPPCVVALRPAARAAAAPVPDPTWPHGRGDQPFSAPSLAPRTK